MCQESTPEQDIERIGQSPLADRPNDELLAVKRAFSDSNEHVTDSDFAVSVTEGEVTLFECGDLATAGGGANETVEFTKSRLWEADIDIVREEIDRRNL